MRGPKGWAVMRGEERIARTRILPSARRKARDLGADSIRPDGRWPYYLLVQGDEVIGQSKTFKDAAARAYECSGTRRDLVSGRRAVCCARGSGASRRNGEIATRSLRTTAGSATRCGSGGASVLMVHRRTSAFVHAGHARREAIGEGLRGGHCRRPTTEASREERRQNPPRGRPARAWAERPPWGIALSETWLRVLAVSAVGGGRTHVD